MRFKLFHAVMLSAAIVTAIASCTDQPSDISPKTVTLDESKLTGTGTFNLGRVLFYDVHLSVNASISCASCHKQALAFSDNVKFSRGFENKLTGRNSLPIQNLSNFFTDSMHLFWDGRETSLGSMVLKPILNHVEMGVGNEEDIKNRISLYPYYKDLFQKAFGSEEISADKISMALAAFVSGISNFNSRFDRYMDGETQMLTGIELQGLSLFFTKYNCNSCHKTDNPGFYQVNNDGFVNIGLDADYADNGRYNVTHNPADRGRFKIPDLRNIALTAPYMHDGRFATLSDVLDHYSHNISDHPNLDLRLKDTNGQAMRMNISNQEKTAIIAFLNTLTDYSMISNPQFSNPFVAN